MTILLLTGPPASGKNTVAEMLAKRLDRCAAIDVDQLREMIVQPSNTTWESRERASQEEVTVRNACHLARNFVDAGYKVVISDVVTDISLDSYRSSLAGINVKTILLLPTEDEIMGRLLSRPDYLSRGEITSVYDQQARFTGFDDRLDNTEIQPDVVVDWLLERWDYADAAAAVK